MRNTATRPCNCWTETWTQHDGHCCFHPDSPEDCHDTEAQAEHDAEHQVQDSDARNGLGGPLMERRYWLTDKGWDAVR